MRFAVRELSIADFQMLTPVAVDLYISAMHYTPAIRSNRINAWRSESSLPGFTSVCATTLDAAPARLLGVAYGFHGTPATWWHRKVFEGLQSIGDHDADDDDPAQDLGPDLLEDYFELAEIHVSPNAQGNGVGRALITALLDSAARRETQVLLSTPEIKDEENRAFHLYRSLGFTDVLREFIFPGDPRPFAILRSDLPLASDTPTPRSSRSHSPIFRY